MAGMGHPKGTIHAPEDPGPTGHCRARFATVACVTRGNGRFLVGQRAMIAGPHVFRSSVFARLTFGMHPWKSSVS